MKHGQQIPPRLQLGDMTIAVMLKNIKNMRLSVHPPFGQVRLSAPRQISLDTLRAFAISRLDWIRQQQRRLREQVRATPHDDLNRESCLVWGQRYGLVIEESDAAPMVALQHQRLVLRVPSHTAAVRREALAAWYREQLRQAIPPLISRWQPVLGVRVRTFSIRQMKTRWGSCTPKTGCIRINAELARKPPECLEYLIVHEMVHLLESSHNARFKALMDQFLPDWRRRKDVLNQAPVWSDNGLID